MNYQKNWDAALIKTWRRAGTLLDAMILFEAISGQRVFECNPPLKRTPNMGYPWRIGVRVFIANHLEKISIRLWEQPPEKDILLLRKLETSPYNTTLQPTTVDNERSNIMAQNKRNKLKIQGDRLAYSNTNKSSDWGVATGSLKIKMVRR